MAGASHCGGAHFFGIDMSDKKGSGKKSPDTPETPSRRQQVADLLLVVESKLKDTRTKATLADFVRLTQLERELEEEERPREIVVTWVNPTENEDTAESDIRRYPPN